MQALDSHELREGAQDQFDEVQIEIEGPADEDEARGGTRAGGTWRAASGGRCSCAELC